MIGHYAPQEQESFTQRNQEIGSILAHARRRESRTVTECAAIAATTRRRYTRIERGEAAVSAVELEALIRFLHVPAHLIWSEFVPTGQPRQVVVHAQPGERVHVVVEVQEEGINTSQAYAAAPMPDARVDSGPSQREKRVR